MGYNKLQRMGLVCGGARHRTGGDEGSPIHLISKGFKDSALKRFRQ